MPENVNRGGQDPRAMGNPHEVPWYWRLINLFQRQSHPLSAEDVTDDAQTQAIQKWWEQKLSLSSNRKERYRVYDEMDQFGLVQTVLDVYAEESTQQDYDRRQAVWIESKNSKMIERGEECLKNVQVEDRITAIARFMCKYGDEFRRLIYQTKKGVLAWKHTKAKTMHRLEDKYSRLIGFRQDGKKFRMKKRDISWPWDYVHFRLLGKDDDDVYGTSILDGLFRSWRQMALTEDSILMYRLRRSPDRNMVFIDIGNMEEHDAMDYVNRWRKAFRKFEFIDPASPQYAKQFNPLHPLEDIFFPKRGAEDNTSVEQLTGAGNVGEVYDLEHFRNAFFGSAKVPKAYGGYEGEINAKATLMQQDVRFARSCKRVQKALIYGLRQLLDIHFTLLPENENDETYDFTQKENAYIVQMAPIAYLDEWERLELVQLRYQIVEAMSRLAMDMQLDPKVWAAYVLLNYAKLPEDLVMKLMSKTPSKPQAGGGGGGFGFEGLDLSKPPVGVRIQQDAWQRLDEDTRRSIVQPIGTEGFYQIDPKEKIAIARLIHESAPLRKVVGDLAEYHEDDMLVEQAKRQTDPSLLPPVSNGIVIEDDYDDDKEAKALQEDMNLLKGGTLKDEKPTESKNEGGEDGDQDSVSE